MGAVESPVGGARRPWRRTSLKSRRGCVRSGPLWRRNPDACPNRRLSRWQERALTRSSCGEAAAGPRGPARTEREVNSRGTATSFSAGESWIGDDRILTKALATRGSVHSSYGELDQAAPLVEEAVPLGARLARP